MPFLVEKSKREGIELSYLGQMVQKNLQIFIGAVFSTFWRVYVPGSVHPGYPNRRWNQKM